MRGRLSRSRVVQILPMVVACGLLVLVVCQNRDQIRMVSRRTIDARQFTRGFEISLVGLLLTFVRWYGLVRVIEPSFRLWHAMLLGFVGNVFNVLVPGAVGGDMVKAAFLFRLKVNKTQVIASLLLDRLLGMLGLFVVAAIAGALAWPVAGVSIRRLIIITWMLLGAGTLGVTVGVAGVPVWFSPAMLNGRGRFSALLAELHSLSAIYRKRLDVVLGAIGLSILCHTLSVLAFYQVSRALFPLGLPSLVQHFLIVPLTLFTTAVPLPFGAIGLSEEVSQQLFALVDHPGGALGMLGFRALTFGGALVSTGIYLVFHRQLGQWNEATE